MITSQTHVTHSVMQIQLLCRVWTKGALGCRALSICSYFLIYLETSSVVSNSVTNVTRWNTLLWRRLQYWRKFKNTYMYIFLTIFSCAKILPVEHFLVTYTKNCIYIPIPFRMYQLTMFFCSFTYFPAPVSLSSFPPQWYLDSPSWIFLGSKLCLIMFLRNSSTKEFQDFNCGF